MIDICCHALHHQPKPLSIPIERNLDKQNIFLFLKESRKVIFLSYAKNNQSYESCFPLHFLFVKVISLIDLIWLLSFPSSTFELNAPQLTIVQPYSMFWFFITLTIVNHINKYIQSNTVIYCINYNSRHAAAATAFSYRKISFV